MNGVYVHLPFCPYLCPYCDFAKWPHKTSSADLYMQMLLREIQSMPDQPAQTVYLGGGTPNTYDAASVAQLLEALRKKFPGPSHRETTIELNPELVRGDDLAAYVAAGVTRVSLGVQSFMEDEIAVLGRRHSVEDVRRAVTVARSCGITSVSLDLMFAVPRQTPQSWRQSLDIALTLAPDHISAYGLTIEPGTPYAHVQQRKPAFFMDEDAEAELYGIAIDRLEQAGFEHYEISNFAQPGHRCVHNMNYWNNGEYIGLGVGAASFRDGVRSTHTRSLQEYISALAQEKAVPSESECLEGARRAGEAVMLALRTSQGLSFAAFKERYGFEFLEHFAPIVEFYREAGMLDVSAGEARLTKSGRFIANEICAAFITAP